MKFLHEFYEYKNGKRYDNGYWEISGDRLFNANGGWHTYNPTPNDEIIDSDWEHIEKMNLMLDFAANKDSDTGWIAPDGTFYGTGYTDHWKVAKYFDVTERDLEDRGFVKIYFNPLWPDHGDKYEYISVRDHLTQAQIDTLEQRGFEV